MIVGCCGFSWSGSSAVEDLLKEFDGTDVRDDFEFVFPYYPDGLEDLDIQLNEKCSKYLSSVVAIPRFRKTAKYLLFKQTKGRIVNITDEYIKKLKQVTWIGAGAASYKLCNNWFYSHFSELFYKILRRLFEKISYKIRLYFLKKYEYSIKPDSFYEITKQYTDDVLKSLGVDIDKVVVLDQPFPGNNPNRCMRYFNNSKAIIVDRDPRDLYLLAKHYYPKRSFQVPHATVKDFVSYYYNMHKHLSKDDNNVLHIMFEDLVYNYEDTVKQICSFLNIDSRAHVRKKSSFIPEYSAANTRLFEKGNYLEDVAFIEKELSDFLFDFEKYPRIAPKDKMFDEMKELNL